MAELDSLLAKAREPAEARNHKLLPFARFGTTKPITRSRMRPIQNTKNTLF